MTEDLDSDDSLSRFPKPLIVSTQKSVQRCHILLPDTPDPVSAVIHNGQYYGYVKFFSTVDAAYRAAHRLIDRDNAVILTRVPKGLVLWVLEAEAQLAKKPSVK